MKGEELKEIRLKLGMSQEDFGKLFGYHQPQVRVSEFEHNRRPIPLRVIDAVGYIREKRTDLFPPRRFYEPNPEREAAIFSTPSPFAKTTVE